MTNRKVAGSNLEISEGIFVQMVFFFSHGLSGRPTTFLNFRAWLVVLEAIECPLR